MRRPSARAGGEKNGRAVQVNCAAVFISDVLPAPQALTYLLLLVSVSGNHIPSLMEDYR